MFQHYDGKGWEEVAINVRKLRDFLPNPAPGGALRFFAYL
jgi:hypothetical protein